LKLEATPPPRPSSSKKQPKNGRVVDVAAVVDDAVKQKSETVVTTMNAAATQPRTIRKTKITNPMASEAIMTAKAAMESVANETENELNAMASENTVPDVDVADVATKMKVAAVAEDAVVAVAEVADIMDVVIVIVVVVAEAAVTIAVVDNDADVDVHSLLRAPIPAKTLKAQLMACWSYILRDMDSYVIRHKTIKPKSQMLLSQAR